ncbi:MAG: ribonuclease E inhibitor RraB [Actinomycetota bacterium]|nr:ribonuclease E inhibitor RraB [Actinomycetota bacterium]
MADDPEWFVQILDLQLQRNPEMLAGLRRQGIDDDAPVRLEFFYLAPGEAEARDLVAFLRQQTDYQVQAFERRAGIDESIPWLVVGMTQPTPVSLDLVNAWTEWMVAAGAEQGPCAFDGWGAQAASSPGP